MTADTSFFFNDSCGPEPNYVYNDSPTSNDSPWSTLSLLPDCIPIQPIPRTMNSPFSAPGFGPAQGKYIRESADDTHHISYNPTAPVQQESFYPNPSNWQSQQNMWTVNPNAPTMAQNFYSTGANDCYGLYDPQWSNTNAQQPYMQQQQHTSVRRAMSQTTSQRYTPYHNSLAQHSMPALTRPFHHSPVAVTPTAMPDTAVSSPASVSWALSPPIVSSQLPESLIRGQASDAHDLPFRQQQQYFNNATSLHAENWTGPFVPQFIYRPHTNSDRKRYVEEVTLAAPLYFKMESPYEYGIPLSDALHSRVKRLVDRDTPVFEGRGPSVSIRLEWPGYRPWTRQIPTKDFRSPPCPITMAKLAKAVAKCVQRFMEENKDRNLDEGFDRKWKVGVRPNEIKLEDVVLVSLHHVSLGSWQPQLRLRRPRN